MPAWDACERGSPEIADGKGNDGAFSMAPVVSHAGGYALAGVDAHDAL
jgi:hypothetical protein